MAEISDRVRAIAYELERARIDLGFDYMKVESESGEWSLSSKPELRAFGIDSDNKSHRWEEGING